MSVSSSVEVVVVHAAVRAIGCPPQPDKRPRRQQVRLHRPRAKSPNAESISVLTSKTPRQTSHRAQEVPQLQLYRLSFDLLPATSLTARHAICVSLRLCLACTASRVARFSFTLASLTTRARQPLAVSSPAPVGSKVKDSQIHLGLLLYLLFFLHLYLSPLFEILRYL